MRSAGINSPFDSFVLVRLFKTDRFATYALSAFIILLPIAFYVAVYVQSEDKRIVYEFVRRSSFKPADDGDVGHSIEVPREEAGGVGAVLGDTASSVSFYTDDHEEITPHCKLLYLSRYDSCSYENF